MQLAPRTTALILVLGVASVSAQQIPWPPDVSVSPQAPTTDQSVKISFSDVWPNSCVPTSNTIFYSYNIEADDDAIYVTIRTPSYFTCIGEATSWEAEVTVPSLNLGCYTVYVASENPYYQDRPFTKVATFCVQEDSGGTSVPWPPQVTVSPQDPTTDDSILLSFSDVWPDSCVPRPDSISYSYNIEADDDAIYVTIRTPSYFTCSDQMTSWRQDLEVRPMNVGCYDVYVSLEDPYHPDQPFTQVAAVCVREGSGAPTMPWPPQVAVRPGNPTTGQSVALTFSDIWPNNCVPGMISHDYNIEQTDDAIHVTLRTPLYFNCMDQDTAWEQQVSVGPLRSKCYDVYVALESPYYADQPSTKVASFCAGDNSGGSGAPWPPALTINPQGATIETGEPLTLTLAGSWPDACVPTSESISYRYEGNAVYVEIAAPLYITCPTQETAWQHPITLRPPAPGSYDVYVELVDSFHGNQPPTKVTTFLVMAVDHGETGQHFDLCRDQIVVVSNMLNNGRCESFSEPWRTSLPPQPTWAPVDAVVTKIEYRVVLESSIRCSDFEISLGSDGDNNSAHVILYDNLGGMTDGGYDDDPEDDRDIDLDWRQTNAFNGQSVHQEWSVCFENTATDYRLIDTASVVTKLCLRVYWEVPDQTMCCGVKPGDRVTLLTDNPRDAFGLTAGANGTVICCDGEDPDLPIFVSWDNWEFGRNSDEYCDTSPLSYAAYSGWWMTCQDIALTGGGDGRPGAGGGGPDRGGSSGPDIVFCVGGQCVSLDADPSAPASSNTYIGAATIEVELNFKGKLTATASSASVAGGTWTAWLDPDIVGPGTVTTTLWVRGENLDIGMLPPGSENVQVAEVHVFVAPAL